MEPWLSTPLENNAGQCSIKSGVERTQIAIIQYLSAGDDHKFCIFVLTE